MDRTVYFYSRSVVTLERKINSQPGRTWSAENPDALRGNPWHSSKIGVLLWIVSKTNFGPTVLWRDNYCEKLSRSFEYIYCSATKDWRSLLVSARLDCRPYCEHNICFLVGFFPVIALSAMYFGHPDHQTLRHLTSSVIAFSALEFGQRDPQTLGHLTSSLIGLLAVDFGHHVP